MKGLLTRLLHVVLPPIGLFVLVVILWQAVVVCFDVKPFILPSPARVLTAAIEYFPKFAYATLLTGEGALCGFLISVVLGILIALLFAQSALIRNAAYPYAIFLQTVPVVAVAPLIITWFGAGFPSVVVVTVIISLFPIITNTTTGLLAIDPDLLDLFRLNNASRLQVMMKLRFPHAVPHMVTGAKISSGLSVIGAIVGEFFAGYGTDRFGLGYLILQTANQLKTNQLFVGVIASTLLGIVIFATVTVLGGTILTRWSGNPPQ